MKSQYEQMRAILEAVYYPVDPRHELAFRAMLLNDKKRRHRKFLWFFLCFLGMLMAGYGAISLLSNKPLLPKPLPQQTDQETTALHSGPGQTTLLQHDDKTTLPLSIQQAESTQTITTTQESTLEETTLANVSAREKRTFPQQRFTPKADNFIVAQSATMHHNTSIPQSAYKVSTDNNVVKSWDDMTPTSWDTNDKSAIASSEENTVGQEVYALLPLPLTEFSYEMQSLHDSPTILPALRKIQTHRIHYGASGALFPAGELLMKSPVKTGYGFQVGGYATYTMTPRLQLRADAGFSKLNGGFSYLKQSMSEQYGFTIVNQTNSLDVEQVYSGYLAGELGMRRGRNTLCIGLLGQFLYGARGDIETVQHFGMDEQPPVVTFSENVWLATKDMQKLSLQGSLGIRSRVTRRLELAALLRIPITQTIRTPHSSTLYQYQVHSHGIAPHFSLSYQINQQ